jgi:hypothetical protein
MGWEGEEIGRGERPTAPYNPILSVNDLVLDSGEGGL